jgi:hypothetical protein
LKILHELAELVRCMLHKIRKATSGEGEGAQQPSSTRKSTPKPPSQPQPRKRTKPKRAKSRRRAPSAPPLTREDFGLLVNYGPNSGVDPEVLCGRSGVHRVGEGEAPQGDLGLQREPLDLKRAQ